MMETGFIRTVRREVRQIMSRRVVMFAMVFIPLFTTLFLTQVMRNGLPEHIPVAIVNLDDTEITRALVRQIASSKEVRVVAEPRSDAEAMKLVREGKTYGYYVIPRNFTRDIMSGHQPQITYYTNSAYLVPGSLLFRNLKTNSVLASGAVVKNYLVSSGTMSDTQAQALLQPVKLQTNPLHNPQTNYGVYLLNSFLPTLLALIILTVTVFSICQETKLHTSPQWLASARGSMTMALLGKLLPYTLVFTAVGSLMQAYLFGYLHYPLACGGWQMVLTMLLYVMANQAFAVFVAGVVPNLRLALSICSLVGMLTFSVGGFSFPVEEMYGSIGIFSYILPARYYFLIYVDQALNGLPLFYSRFYYIALLVFLLLPFTVVGNLRRNMLKPVYIP